MSVVGSPAEPYINAVHEYPECEGTRFNQSMGNTAASIDNDNSTTQQNGFDGERERERHEGQRMKHMNW